MEKECYLHYTEVWKQGNLSRFISESGCNTVAAFIQKVSDNLSTASPMSEYEIHRAGCVILRKVIINKFNHIKKDAGARAAAIHAAKTIEAGGITESDVLAKIDERLEYFNSAEFLEQFVKAMPVGGTFADQQSRGYTSYLRNLFSADIDVTKKIRSQQLETTKAITQCTEALTQRRDHAYGHDCYLCGCKMVKPQQLECEHILPILPVLSHLWMARSGQSLAMQQSLALEYAWSHRCCNQWKSDKEFIVYDEATGFYKVDGSVLGAFRTKLGNSSLQRSRGEVLYGCDKMPSVFPCYTSNEPHNAVLLYKRLNLIKDQMNANLGALAAVGRPDLQYCYYLLLCKFKLISAFSDENFLNRLLLGWKPVDVEISQVERDKHHEVLKLKQEIDTLKNHQKKATQELDTYFKRRDHVTSQLVRAEDAATRAARAEEKGREQYEAKFQEIEGKMKEVDKAMQGPLKGQLTKASKKHQVKVDEAQREQLLYSKLKKEKEEMDASIKKQIQLESKIKSSLEETQTKYMTANTDYKVLRDNRRNLPDEEEGTEDQGGGAVSLNATAFSKYGGGPNTEQKIIRDDIIIDLLTNPKYNPTEEEIVTAIKNIYGSTKKSESKSYKLKTSKFKHKPKSIYSRAMRRILHHKPTERRTMRRTRRGTMRGTRRGTRRRSLHHISSRKLPQKSLHHRHTIRS